MFTTQQRERLAEILGWIAEDEKALRAATSLEELETPLMDMRLSVDALAGFKELVEQGKDVSPAPSDQSRPAAAAPRSVLSRPISRGPRRPAIWTPYKEDL
jgi:hypothetical protein